jgi:multiple sugar transport system substrate-binding protein
MNFSRNQIIVIGAVGLVIIVFILGLMGIIPGFKKSSIGDPNFPTGSVKLEMWGVGDDSPVFSDVIKSYQDIYKNVRINYTKFNDLATYQKELVNALAENRGPDIFMVNNLWVYGNWGKLYPAPPLLLTTQVVSQIFPSVVSKDFVLSGNIFALPLSMDALALIYNKDIFNAKSIVFPPATWDEFVSDITKIREIDQNKKISLSATALGTAYNVDNVLDILSVLALQSGSVINNPTNDGIRFDDAFNKTVNFYTQFADPVSPYYTWNESFDNSITSFATGKTAMILNYYNSLNDIKNRNTYINLGIAALPQVTLNNSTQLANWASYLGLAASRQTQNPYVAWHFIKYLTTTPSVSSIYLAAANKLPVLLSLIQQGLGGNNDVFLREFLTAKSWYQADPQAISAAFRGMINDILSGKINTQNAIKATEELINKLYQPATQ